MLKQFAVVGALVVALAAFVPTAGADPVNAKRSLAFTATCDGIPVPVVVNGGPALVTNSTSVIVVQALDYTSTFTPTGGAPQTDVVVYEKAHLHDDLVTCTFDTTQSVPGGTLHVVGSATGFFTPVKH